MVNGGQEENSGHAKKETELSGIKTSGQGNSNAF